MWPDLKNIYIENKIVIIKFEAKLTNLQLQTFKREKKKT